MRQPKSFITLVVILFFALLAAGLMYVTHVKQTANVKLVVSPYAATIVLDGSKRIHEGTFYVQPGNHTISASFDGFASNSTKFTAVTNKLTAVNLLLEPNSQLGYDWLDNHPDDVAVRQNIGGNNYNKAAQQTAKSTPIIADLPYVERYFRIDYGASKAHPNDSSAVGIYITYYETVGKQQALDWIKQAGYDSSKLELIYSDQTPQPSTELGQ